VEKWKNTPPLINSSKDSPLEKTSQDKNQNKIKDNSNSTNSYEEILFNFEFILIITKRETIHI